MVIVLPMDREKVRSGVDYCRILDRCERNHLRGDGGAEAVEKLTTAAELST